MRECLQDSSPGRRLPSSRVCRGRNAPWRVEGTPISTELTQSSPRATGSIGPRSARRGYARRGAGITLHTDTRHRRSQQADDNEGATGATPPAGVERIRWEQI